MALWSAHCFPIERLPAQTPDQTRTRNRVRISTGVLDVSVQLGSIRSDFIDLRQCFFVAVCISVFVFVREEDHDSCGFTRVLKDCTL